MSLSRREILAGAAIAMSANLMAAPRTATGAEPRFWIAALTMLDRSRKLDETLTKDYLAYLAQGGADGALVMGSTGEFASFSVSERKRNLEVYFKHRGNLAIMAQIGTSNLPETLDLLDHAGGLGVDRVLVLPPHYYRNVKTEGLVGFFRPVLDRSKVPVLLYNIPQTSGVPITPELLQRLAGHPNMAGIKDSFSKAEALTGFLQNFSQLQILTGLPQLLSLNLQEGGGGIITGNGSIFLKETKAVFDAHRAGEDLGAPQKALTEVSQLLSGYDGVPAMKYILSRRGLRESYPRVPFLELTAKEKQDLEARFRASGKL